MEVKFIFFLKMVTTSWKITKMTEENIWSKILLYAKRNKLYSFEEEASHQKPDRTTSFFRVLSLEKLFPL